VFSNSGYSFAHHVASGYRKKPEANPQLLKHRSLIINANPSRSFFFAKPEVAARNVLEERATQDHGRCKFWLRDANAPGRAMSFLKENDPKGSNVYRKIVNSGYDAEGIACFGAE
jgi:hypothetical protein